MRVLSASADSQSIATKNYVLSANETDVKNAKNVLRSLCFTYAEQNGYNKIVLDLFSDNTEFTLGSGLTYDSTNDVISGTGVVTIVNDVFTSITSAMVIGVCNGAVTYEFSRNDGTNWQSVTEQTNITSFTHSGTTVKIRATLTNATLIAWAYLIKE